MDSGEEQSKISLKKKVADPADKLKNAALAGNRGMESAVTSAPKLYDMSKLKPARFGKVVKYILQPEVRHLNSDLSGATVVKKKTKITASIEPKIVAEAVQE